VAPLALNYIINRLRRASGVAVADTFNVVDRSARGSTGSTPPSGVPWRTTSTSCASSHSSPARAASAPRVDASLGVTSGVAQRHDASRYLFRQEHGGRWTFFHNSFVRFSSSALASSRVGGDAELFTELARTLCGG